MNIRTGTLADVPAILALERETPSASHWSEENYNSIFAQNSTRRIVLIADVDDLPAAFLVARIVDPDWEIENIVVDARHRRQRIGSALLSKLLKQAHAERAAKILLEVRESNSSARSFYEKLGFVSGGSRSRYYQDPSEDAIYYLLEIRGLPEKPTEK